MAHSEKIGPADADRACAANATELGLPQLALARLLDKADVDVEQPPRDKLTGLASKLYDSRRARSQYFKSSLLGEPVWDMLLALFCLPRRRWTKRLTVGDLANAARLSRSTALRWSRVMEQNGLIERTPDPVDARRTLVALSDKGEQLMCSYLSSVYHRLGDVDHVK